MSQDVIPVVKDFILGTFLPGEDPQLLTPTTELIGSGILNSLETLELMNFLEEQFEIEIEAQDLGEHLGSLAEIEQFVNAKRAASPS